MRTSDDFDFKEYAGITLNDGIYRIITSYPLHRRPDNGLVIHELNKIADGLGINVRFDMEEVGGVVIAIDSDHDAVRSLDILFVFSAVYPTLLNGECP